MEVHPRTHPRCEIPLFKTYWDESDIEAVNASIRRGTQWAEGPNIEAFERALCEYTGTRYAVVFNSGTSALHAAMLSLGIGPGDEVIVPSFTFIATANCVLMVGAKPVFADIETETLGLDPQDVERKITSKTKAIIPVHYAGMPCRIENLLRVAVHIPVVEDACEALGATVGLLINGRRVDQRVGTFGDVGVYSFCQSKIISTGEGGALVTSDYDLAEEARFFRSHGRDEGTFVCLGYNWRMPDMNAALGLSQLAKIDKLIAMRQEVAKAYHERLPSQVTVPNLPAFRMTNVYPGNWAYQMFPVLVKDRNGLMNHLKERGIASKVYFHPVHQSPYYQSLGYRDSLPVTKDVASKVLSLPIWPGFEDVERVCDAVKEFVCQQS